jgi:hypothetical protein
MNYRPTRLIALGAATAATLLVGMAGSGQLALASMSTPLSPYGHSAATPPPPPPPSPKKCPANTVQGTIGGQSKCLAVGQQCQQARAADYTRFGFTCTKVGNTYVLRKPTKPVPSGKPTPPMSPKPAPTSPKPAPPT